MVSDTTHMTKIVGTESGYHHRIGMYRYLDDLDAPRTTSATNYRFTGLIYTPLLIYLSAGIRPFRPQGPSTDWALGRCLVSI